MSVQHIGWALGQPTGSPTTKVVLVALANRVNPDTELCCPSISRLVFETELSRSTVKRALAALENDGLLVKVRRQRENGSDTSNEYRFPYVTLTKGGFTVDPGPAQSGPPPRSTVDPPEPKELTQRETKDLAAPPLKPTRQQQDAVWDVLTDIFGPVTTRKNERARGMIVQELLEAGAVPDEIVRRAKSWPSHFDDAPLTQFALVKWWDTLGRKPLRRQ